MIIVTNLSLFIYLFFPSLTYHCRLVNSTLHPPGAPSREETGTGIDLVALHREVDEAVLTLLQLATTLCDEVHPAPAFVIASSQTGVVENAVSDSAIANVTPRSST